MEFKVIQENSEEPADVCAKNNRMAEEISQRKNSLLVRLYCSAAESLQSCPTLCSPVDYSTPGLLVLHYVLELAQTHIHRVGEAIQPSHLLSPPSPPPLNLSQHQGLFQWVGFSHQIAKVLEPQLQHQSFQWILSVVKWCLCFWIHCLGWSQISFQGANVF